MKSARKTDGAESNRKAARQAEPVAAETDGGAPPPPSTAAEPLPLAEAEGLSAAPSMPPADDRLLRLQADFDNYRKRVLREKEDLYVRANEDIMEELLPVLDHLDLALAAVGDSERNDPIVKGFKLVGEQLLSVLGRFGLTPIAAEGVDFDPNLHEAILHLPSAEVPENGIVTRTRAGYMLGGKLLRAAQVVVSSGAPEASGDGAGDL